MQVAKLRFLALGNADYALLSYCFQSPSFVGNYLGVVSRKRTFDEIPEDAMTIIKDKATSLGVDWDMEMCNVDCSMCAN